MYVERLEAQAWHKPGTLQSALRQDLSAFRKSDRPDVVDKLKEQVEKTLRSEYATQQGYRFVVKKWRQTLGLDYYQIWLSREMNWGFRINIIPQGEEGRTLDVSFEWQPPIEERRFLGILTVILVVWVGMLAVIWLQTRDLDSVGVFLFFGIVFLVIGFGISEAWRKISFAITANRNQIREDETRLRSVLHSCAMGRMSS